MIKELYFQFTCNLQVDYGWCIHLQVTNDPLELNWSKEIHTAEIATLQGSMSLL